MKCLNQKGVNKFERGGSFYNPTNLTYNKVSVPVQKLWVIPSTKSLFKNIDTPVRETMSNWSVWEDNFDTVKLNISSGKSYL